MGLLGISFLWPRTALKDVIQSASNSLIDLSSVWISKAITSFAEALRLQQLRRLIDPIVLDLDGK
jgi:hypothetical protein